jgi:1-phosphatidylinositol-3-phosphate 5-kinase
MAVARIEAHHPNILLVEKTVSRFAQDRLLAREISVVLNVKRPLLERIAQCTGAQVSSYFLQNCPLRYFGRHSLTFA